MDIDESLIGRITDPGPSWELGVRGRRFVPDSVEFSMSATPVRRPGTRGGAYFSDTEACRISCAVSDPSIAPLLSSTMLGPNKDFTPIELTATSPGSRHLIRANLASYVQAGTGVRMSLMVVDVST